MRRMGSYGLNITSVGCSVLACVAPRRPALQQVASAALLKRASVLSCVAGETGGDVVRGATHRKNMVVRAICHIAPGLAISIASGLLAAGGRALPSRKLDTRCVRYVLDT